MAWIKRNLSLVISGVVALALLGVGGWYLWSAIEKNKQVDSEIGQIKADIEGLLTKPVTPNQQNLTLAKQQFDKLNAFVLVAKKHFPPTPPPGQPLDNQSFKSLLQTTVDELHKQARSIGITVETNYFFTFDEQRLPVMFPPESLRPLSERLSEVQLICSILFKSRINRLVGVRRAAVPGERIAPGSPRWTIDYLPAQARLAESGMTLWPYEVTFNCFSVELAAVLDALQRVDYGIVVKSIVTDSVREAVQLAVRPQGRATNAPPQSLVTIIDERPILVTLRLEVIKPSPPPPR